MENDFVFSDSINLDSDFITSNDINYSSNKAASDIPDTIDYVIDYFLTEIDIWFRIWIWLLNVSLLWKLVSWVFILFNEKLVVWMGCMDTIHFIMIFILTVGGVGQCLWLQK